MEDNRFASILDEKVKLKKIAQLQELSRSIGTSAITDEEASQLLAEYDWDVHEALTVLLDGGKKPSVATSAKKSEEESSDSLDLAYSPELSNCNDDEKMPKDVSEPDEKMKHPRKDSPSSVVFSSEDQMELGLAIEATLGAGQGKTHGEEEGGTWGQNMPDGSDETGSASPATTEPENSAEPNTSSTNASRPFFPRPPAPSNNTPGAFAVPGLDGPVVDNGDDQYTTTGAASEVSRPFQVTARLVENDEQEQVEDLQEEIAKRNREVERMRRDQENAALVQVVDEQKCLEGPRRKLIAIVAGVLVAVVIVLSVVLTRKPASTRQDLIDSISSISFDGGEALRTPSTPQNRAYNWLANNNTFLDYYSDERKIQRYVLATLYYSTNGDSWYDNAYWLTDIDECGWYNKANNGPFCVNGSVVELDFYRYSGNKLVGTIPGTSAK